MPNRVAPRWRLLDVVGTTLVLTTLGFPRAGAASSGSAALTQGVTTAAVRGTVRIGDGSDPSGVRVSVRNSATGFVVEADLRNGRFFIQGLEVGGPYHITVRRIGVRPERRDIGFLSLGEPYELHLVLEPAPVQLDSLVVVLPAGRFSRSNSHGGTATTITDSLLHHLPSLNRDLYDFVRLVPQISTRIGLGFAGISGGGVGFRFNQFLTNGVPERSLAGGQPPEFAGGKSLPFEAVGEYQVLLAPFDVRYGDFAGAAVNTVTRSGTNQFRGSLFGQFRNDALARGDTLPYERGVFGFSLSGPIAKDRVHFLIATEFQRLTEPMAGPYVGQPADMTQPVPVREADLARLETIMRSYGLTAGSGGAVQNRNPLRNVFARLDAAIPNVSSRAVLWLSDAESENLSFARLARDTTFALSSQASTSELGIRTRALQIHTALPRRGGGHNELFLSRRSTRLRSLPEVRQPIVTVAVPGATGGGVISVITGTPTQAQGGDTRSRSVNLRDNLTLPLGRSHVASFGIEAEWFRVEPGGLLNSFGTWGFLSLDSLATGLAERFEVARDLGGGSIPLTGAQYSAYAGDHWLLGGRLSLTLGVRADLLDIDGRPPYNRAVDSIFGRRTDQLPGAHVHLSPRFGFTWNPDGTGRDQVRGGVGIFTGRPPLAWFHTPLRNYGFGTGILRCGRSAGSQGPAPPFEPDPLMPPTACAGGSNGVPTGDVELVDRRLRMARTLRGVLAWDRRLPGDLLATAEALFTRNLSDFIFVNLNLVGPQSADQHGRTLYGTIDALGRASPALRTRSFPSVIDLQSVSANYSIQLSARLEKRFSGGLAAMAAYTWSRVRDVQTPLRVNTRGVVNWSSRAVSGRHEDLSAGVSLNDVPHRIILAGTWRAPWPRWTTELSFLYVGESGSPFTYLAFGLRPLGDLNADGSAANDPIYVPRDATDPGEIVFSDQAQAVAFERFIEDSPCLRRQRGRIMERNSCREPWSHTSVVSLRQRVPVVGRGIEAQLDVFNLLNLLNGSWGIRRVAAPEFLEHVGQTTGPTGNQQPVFRFQDVASPWTILPAESAFQLQLGVAYRF
ncbi:MAG TPA: hypothetical protein VGA78_17605 [Gemmatimonadales bacterium]